MLRRERGLIPVVVRRVKVGVQGRDYGEQERGCGWEGAESVEMKIMYLDSSEV